MPPQATANLCAIGISIPLWQSTDMQLDILGAFGHLEDAGNRGLALVDLDRTFRRGRALWSGGGEAVAVKLADLIELDADTGNALAARLLETADGPALDVASYQHPLHFRKQGDEIS